MLEFDLDLPLAGGDGDDPVKARQARVALVRETLRAVSRDEARAQLLKALGSLDDDWEGQLAGLVDKEQAATCLVADLPGGGILCLCPTLRRGWWVTPSPHGAGRGTIADKNVELILTIAREKRLA